jgi:hypothetical protein
MKQIHSNHRIFIVQPLCHVGAVARFQVKDETLRDAIERSLTESCDNKRPSPVLTPAKGKRRHAQ